MLIPYKQEETRVYRTYKGGRLIDEFLSKADCTDCNKPEDWITSFTEAKNKNYTPGEGITNIITPSGKLPLTEAAKPHWFGKGRNSSDVLIKLLDSAERLGIQVHPTPDFSKKHFGTDFGKTECWHILGTRAHMDGAIYIGFKEGISKELWKELFDRQDIPGMLNMLHRFEVSPGDTILVKAGTPHAIGAGCFLLEIQEPSDYTMRVEKTTVSGQTLTDMQIHYGVGIDNMMDCFLYRGMTREEAYKEYFVQPQIADNCTHLATYDDTPCFKMDRICDGFTLEADCMTTLVITNDGRLTTAADTIPVKKGDKYLIPYGCKVTVSGGAEAIVCYPPQRKE